MNQVIAEGEGFTEKWNRRQIEMAAERDAEFEAALERELLGLMDSGNAAAEENQREDAGAQLALNQTKPGDKTGPSSSFASASTTAGSKKAPAVAYKEQELDAKDLFREPYEFPVEVTDEWPHLKEMSVAELADRLHNLSIQMIGKGQLRPYHEIREEVCAINIELNRRGKLAPQFRDMRRPPYKVKTINERDLSRDRQIIDLHWLHCIGWNEVIECDRLHLRKLLMGPSFSLEHAEMFAEVPAPFSEKADWLALTDDIAFQLAAIQTDAVRERLRVATVGDIREGKVVQRGRRQIAQALRTSVANQPHFHDQVSRWAMIWMCSRLVGDNAEVLRRFHAVAEGLETPLDRRDIARRLTAIERRLGEIRAAGKMAA